MIKKLFALAFVPCLLLFLMLPASAATIAPVINQNQNWTVVTSTEDSMTIETVVVAGRIFHGIYTDGLDLAKTDQSFSGTLDTQVGNNSINSVQLGLALTGDTYQTGLIVDGDVDVTIWNEAVYELVSSVGSVPVTYSNVPSEIHFAYGYVDANSLPTEFTASVDRTFSGTTSAEINIPSVDDGRNMALFLRFDMTNIPLEDYGSDTPLTITSKWRIRLTGTREEIEPYISGTLEGVLGGTISSIAHPELGLDYEVPEEGLTFLSGVLDRVRAIPWVGSSLILAATWSIIAFVLWKK